MAIKQKRAYRATRTMALPLWRSFKPRRSVLQQLKEEVVLQPQDREKIDRLLEEILAEGGRFDEKLLGGGPWEVVYSRGPLAWKQWTALSRFVNGRGSDGGKGAGGNRVRGGGGRASQEFVPRGRRLINRGQVAGEAVSVVAEGTYQPQGNASAFPVLIKATVSSGRMNLWGRVLPLPIRGSGEVVLEYVDRDLRVFRSPATGALTVQLRQGRQLDRYQNTVLDTQEWLGSVLVVVRSCASARGDSLQPKASKVPSNLHAVNGRSPHTHHAAASQQSAAGPAGHPMQLLLEASPTDNRDSHPAPMTHGSPAGAAGTPAAAPQLPGSRTPSEAQRAQLGQHGLHAQQAQQAQHGQPGEQVIAQRLLDSFGGWDFLRFDLRIPLPVQQRQVRYSLLVPEDPPNWVSTGAVPVPPGSTALHGTASRHPQCAAAAGETGAAPGFDPGSRGLAGWKLRGSYAFWVPGRGQPMHAGYYSCSGISADVAPDAPERSDPCYLWKDLLGVHSAFPLHVLIGGGDQVYSDPVWKVPQLKAWTQVKHKSKRLSHPWTADMAAAAEEFYARNYLEGFMQPLVARALCTIPQVMMWDDHDIWDGWGSYPNKLQRCPVFQGLFAAAKRAYLLFQQHTTEAHNQGTGELLGDREFHYLKYLGPQVALLGIDMRTKRELRAVMPQSSYHTLEEILQGLSPSVEHLLVMSGVPLIFPKVPWMETLLVGLESAMDGSETVRGLVKQAGLADQFAHPGILDDLVDGWAANVHKKEKLTFVRLLQSVSERRGVRVSILSGDAHVCGVGRLYSHPRMKDLSQDPLFMTQIMSSAIMNAPPPLAVTRTLNRISRARNLDHRTREKMVRVFKSRHPKFPKLLRMRNWCDISVLRPPWSAPMDRQDTLYGGIRFCLRCEDSADRQGHAEEVYEIFVPRIQGCAKVEECRLKGTAQG